MAKAAGPIKMPAVVTLSKETGILLDAWGENRCVRDTGNITTPLGHDRNVTDVSIARL